LTNAESFLYAKYWLDYLEQRSPRCKTPDSPAAVGQKFNFSKSSITSISSSRTNRAVTILLVGNKRDQLDSVGSQRRVSRNLARNLAAAHGAEYVEISARHDLNLTDTVLGTLGRMGQEIPTYTP